MSDETLAWRMTEYEGFEIHVATPVEEPEAASAAGRSSVASSPYTYIGYVCHPGADPKLPGHVVPFHADEISKILSRSNHVIVVENNYSGQFARYLRNETGIEAHGHIRKYDGEPFMPHHIVDGVKSQLAGKTKLSVPTHEVLA